MRKPIAFAVSVTLTLLFLLVCGQLYNSAFPEISISFQLPKGEVEERTDHLAAGFGLEPAAYRRAMTFGEAVEAKYFLEQSYGLSRLRSDVAAGVNIWNWQVRYFQPGQQEEFTLALDTEGRLVGFEHVIPETEQRPKLDREVALQLAEGFLLRNAAQHQPDTLRLVESGEQERAGHYIYRFTWQRTDWQWGDGSYRLQVEVAGDRVGRYREFLDVPEQWQRDFAHRRSINRVFQSFASAGLSLLGIGFIIMFILLAIRHQVTWRGFAFRWMAPVGLVLFGAQLSQFPDVLASYSTTKDFGSFIAGFLLRNTYGTLISLISMLGVAFMADVFWRQTFPRHVSIRDLLSGRGLLSDEAVRAVPLAFLLAAFTLLYVIVYYILGREVGFWTPASIDYAKVLTSYAPAIEALAVGISAAWNEEFMFRVLGLVLVYRLSGSKWLAIGVTALVWGFLHSTYPQLPGYARGIELTIEGVLLGWIAVRYGILTTLLSHCLFNTWLGAIYAWQTGEYLHMGMAVVVSLWPAAVWLWAVVARSRGRFHVAEDAAAASPPLWNGLKELAGWLPVRWTRLNRRALGLMLLFIAAGVGLGLLGESGPLADLGRVEITREEAEQSGDRYLRQELGVEPAGYHRLTGHYSYISGDSEYLLEHAELDTVADHLRRFLYQDYWRIKYFKAEQREHFTVYLKPDGSPMYLVKSVAESAPGAELEETEALAVAASLLESHLGLQTDQYRYVRHDMRQLKARRDYQVAFESTAWRIGESKLRWIVALQGHELGGITPHLKVPEEYRRERMKQGWRDVLHEFVSDITAIIVMLAGLALFVFLAVRHCIDWRLSFLLGLFFLVGDAALELNNAPRFLLGYSTTQTMLNYVAGRGVQLAVALLFSYLKGVGLFALLLGLLRFLTGRSAREVLFGQPVASGCGVWRDGLLMAWVGLVMVWLWGMAGDAVLHLFSSKGLLSITSVDVEGWSPGGALIFEAVRGGLGKAVSGGVYLLALVLLWQKSRPLAGLLLVLMVLESYAPDWRHGFESLHGFVFGLGSTLLKIWLFVRLFRFNWYAYFFLYYYQLLLPEVAAISQQAWPAYAPEVLVAWAAVLLPLFACGAISRLRLVLGQGGQGEVMS